METCLNHLFFFHPPKQQWGEVPRTLGPVPDPPLAPPPPRSSRPRWCCGTGRPWTRRCGCGGWPRPRSCWRPPSWSWGTGASGPRGGRCWSPPPEEKFSVSGGGRGEVASLGSPGLSDSCSVIFFCNILQKQDWWNISFKKKNMTMSWFHSVDDDDDLKSKVL